MNNRKYILIKLSHVLYYSTITINVNSLYNIILITAGYIKRNNKYAVL